MKLFLVFVSLLSLTLGLEKTFESAHPLQNVDCSGIDDFEYLRSPIDCSIYYQCIAEEAYLLSCPRGLYFSVEFGTCTTYDEANCEISSPTTVPAPTTTPGSSVNCDGVQNFRFVASPLSCTNYYQCIDGNAFLLSCPRGLYFDEQRQTCDTYDNVNCLVTPSPPISTTPTVPTVTCEGVENFQLIPSELSCSDYYQCIDSIPYLLSCPRGLYFNKGIQTCDYPANVDCFSRGASTDQTICENIDNFKLVPHPTSCAFYFQCLNGAGFLASCPVARYFDERIQGCAGASEVDCGDRARRPEVTTRAPLIDPQCRDVEEGSFVRNENSCTSYYQCIDGRANPRFCENELWFDESIGKCDIQENVRCHLTTVTPTFPTVGTVDPDNVCANLNEVYVGSRTYCERFYYCINGESYPNTCQQGLHFDRELGICRPQDEVNCDLKTQAPSTTESTTTSQTGICGDARNGTFVRNEFSCGKFFICIDDEPFERECQTGLWFNFNQQRCTPSSFTFCELNKQVCDGIENEATVRMPDSCSEFVTCINGQPFPGRCWNDLFFNEETQRCDDPENVECDLVDLPTEPPRHSCDGIPDFLLAANLENCSEYFVCYDNEIFLTLECPENQNFDEETQVCRENFECSQQ